MSKTTLASALSYLERKVMHEVSRAKEITITNEELAQAKKERHEIKKGLEGKNVDNFLKINIAKKPIKAREKTKKQEEQEDQVEDTKEVSDLGK